MLSHRAGLPIAHDSSRKTKGNYEINFENGKFQFDYDVSNNFFFFNF